MNAVSFSRLAAALLSALPMVAGAVPNGIAAVVNGRPILKSDVEELYRASELDLRRRFPDPGAFAAEKAKLRQKVLDALIEQELILKEYEPFKATFDKKMDAYAEEIIRTQYVGKLYKGDHVRFMRDLDTNGISLKRFKEQQRNNVIMESMRSQFARIEKDFVTADEKAAYLREHGDEFRIGDKIKLWSITVPGEMPGTTKAEQALLAKEIRTKLVKGDDFATLARTYSQDSKSDAGGSWGWVEKKDISLPIWNLVSRLESKKISEVITFDGNFYLFWIEARTPGQLKPREELEPLLEQRILGEKRRKAGEEWVHSLKRKATIVYPAGSPAAPPAVARSR